MRPTTLLTFAALSVALALAGCGTAPGTGLTTSSVAKPQTIAARSAVDPACMTLTAQINAARQEGTPARIQAVATGKTKTVSVKRASLAKVTELDRLNSEFQMKCSKYPGIQSAAIAPTAVRPAPVVKRPIATAKTVKQPAKIAAQVPAVNAPIDATKPIVAVPKQ